MREKLQKRYRRHKRVRAKIFGTAKIPRFCVFRSNKHIYGQLIDDEKGYILVSVSDLGLKNQKTKKPKNQKTGKVAIAYEVGRLIAKKALEKKIEKVIFDRGGYKYHGRIKVLTEGAREEGLIF